MTRALSSKQACVKRTFDFVLALILLVLFGWLILLAWLATSLADRGNGLFRQTRIGRGGKPFTIYKIKTMRPVAGISTTVTTGQDRRITWLGRWLRRTKVDELPQLFNVLAGSMSFVGPRPDVAGFADLLEGEDRMILDLRPGITGPATLAFRDEEEQLAGQADPEAYNRTHIWPAKVRINKDYIVHYRFRHDMLCILATAIPGFRMGMGGDTALNPAPAPLLGRPGSAGTDGSSQ